MHAKTLFAGALGIAGVVLGTACPTPPCIGSGGGAAPYPATPYGTLEPYWIASPDSTISIVLNGPATYSACDTPPEVTGLRIEVTDPLNQQPEASSEILGSSPPTARVSFPARVPGRHHVQVIFEPNLGTAQADALVVRDIREAQKRTIDKPCGQLQALENGTLLCGWTEATSGTPQTVLIRPDDSQVPLPPGAVYAVSGNVLWSREATAIRRLEDSGSGIPVETATLLGGFTQPVQQLLASDTELLVLARNELQRFVFDPADASIRWDGGVNLDGRSAAMVRGEDAIILARDDGTGLGAEVSRYTLSGDNFPAEEFGRLSAPLRGVDARGFWIGPDALSGEPCCGSTSTDTMSYVTEVAGRLSAELVFRAPGGFGAIPPNGLFGSGNEPVGFTGGAAGLVPFGALNESGNPPQQPLLMPFYDGRDLTFDLLSQEAGPKIRFGQFGDYAWFSNVDDGAVTVVKRGP